MPAELITYGADRRLVLANAEAIRPPIYTDTWTKIRIGLRLSFSGVIANIVGTPVLAFGVCNGNLNGASAPSSDHVVGFRTHITTMTYAAGPPATLGQDGTSHRFFKRVGTTQTNGDSGGLNKHFSADTTVRSGLFLEITKGSPNFSFVLGFANSSVGAQSDLTDNEFQLIMELASLATIDGVKANYSSNSASAVTVAVDEGTNGALDHIFVFWDRTVQKFGFDIKHRRMA